MRGSEVPPVPAIENLDSDSFEKTIKESKGRILVEFYADWCRDCIAVAPVLESVAEQFSDTLRVVRIDMQTYPEKAREYGVKHIPHFMLFEDGTKVREAVEITSREALESFLQDPS
jgi:thioredoxin 1